ncbi:MAG: hypothetical protein R3B96_10635 [Pirellulaceae bacterium]
MALLYTRLGWLMFTNPSSLWLEEFGIEEDGPKPRGALLVRVDDDRPRLETLLEELVEVWLESPEYSLERFDRHGETFRHLQRSTGYYSGYRRVSSRLLRRWIRRRHSRWDLRTRRARAASLVDTAAKPIFASIIPPRSHMWMSQRCAIGWNRWLWTIRPSSTWLLGQASIVC